MISNRICTQDIDLDTGLYRAVYTSEDEHGYRGWTGNPPYDPRSWGMTLKASRMSDLASVSQFDPFESLPMIVSLTGIGDDALVSHTFTVEEPMRVLIYAIGEGFMKSNEIFDYAWLVDENRRREVWRMSVDQTKHAGGSWKNLRAETVLDLEPGAYTVHYKTDGSHSFPEWNDDPPLNPMHWGVSVFSLDPNFVPSIDVEIPVLPVVPPPKPGIRDEPLVSLTQLGDYASVSERFVLEHDAELHIFALGEMTLDGRYDYGWITDAATGEIVWEMTRKQSTKAGASSKNRKVDTSLRLPAGEYEVHYRTDDSHSYPGFKYGGAPDHPEAWGITVWLVTKHEAGEPPEPPTRPEPPEPPRRDGSR
jgi:hypothetical protein